MFSQSLRQRFQNAQDTVKAYEKEVAEDDHSDVESVMDDGESSTAVESDSPEEFIKGGSYVRDQLRKNKKLPPLNWKNVWSEVQWVSTLALTTVPIVTIYGLFTTKLTWQTALWSVVYYFITGLGITAGYHRLWAHRAFNATLPLQIFLAFAGAGAVEGSIRWWSRGHRAHHRYTDTELDPYSAHKGFFYSHIGWMLVKPRQKPGAASVSDLDANAIVRWQHKFYIPLIFTMGLVVPTVVAGLCWNDWRGGFFFAAAGRLMFVHHSTFCVNSLAHWLGDAPYDDARTPRDHFITALVTIGEGYHNFHHTFPSDYRNGIGFFSYDPTKWFIAFCSFFGLAYQLKKFPENEINKGKYAMQLKKLDNFKKSIQWPRDSNDLPILSWDEFQEQCKTRQLVVIGGFIHDVEPFLEGDDHPGGSSIIRSRLGKDATNAFNGGVYSHSAAGHNLLSMMRVGVIEGGMEVEALKKNPKVPVIGN